MGHRGFRDQAEVARARHRVGGMGDVLVARRVQVDLVLAEGERRACAGEDDLLHPQHAAVERAGGVDVGDRQDHVVEAVDGHRCGHGSSLPPEVQLTSGELRPTISQVRSRSKNELDEAMNDASNWVGLLTHFDYERALSGYIAAYPHRLEDGLLPHPNKRVRERIFDDRSRLDVLLTDRSNVPVIVECKQGSPTIDHLKQIRNYMKRLRKETGIPPRGILVHGGARKLPLDVAAAALRKPEVEIVQYILDVNFARCD